VVRRLTDLIGSIIGLIALSPLLIIIIFIIKLKLGTPVIFSQLRPGLNEKTFKFYKFRTMTNAKSADGSLLPDKDRVTPLGNFLRKTSLDELPSLFNVLKGDMSLVGPRPLLVEYLELYSPEQARRHEVKPGITGWAQVNGRNGISWEEKFTLDVWYIDNQSFWLDIKILWKTAWGVLKREGISHPNHVSMEPFRGSK